jgi:SAM-dependent methyltransferase
MVHERSRIATLDGADERFVEDAARYRFACRHVRGCTVLDIACGTGYGSRMLIDDGGARRVIAADISTDALDVARTFAAAGRLAVVRTSASHIALRDAAVDAVVSLETLEHVDAPEIFVPELRRVLRPGGVAVISTPLNLAPERVRPENPFHLREYNDVEFAALLEPSFRHVEVYGQFTDYVDDDAWIDRWRRAAPRRTWAALRAIVPPALRRGLRTVSRSAGRHAVRSVVSAEICNAAVQIAVCR